VEPAPFSSFTVDIFRLAAKSDFATVPRKHSVAPAGLLLFFANAV
jgi:hypothetical protein